MKAMRVSQIGIPLLLSVLTLSGNPCNASPANVRDHAISIAQAVLDDFTREGKSGWTADSRPVAAYPVYMPGIDEVSYYEVKVKTDLKDAGYILVNVNNSDTEVPELTARGLTLTEMYAKQTRHNDLKILRYDWFRSAACRKSGNGYRIVATLGFDESPHVRVLDGSGSGELRKVVEEFDWSYRNAARQKHCVPFYLKESVDEYYIRQKENSAPTADASGEISGKKVIQPLSGDTNTRYFLKYIFRIDGGLPVAGDFDRDGRRDDVGIYNHCDRDWWFDNDRDGRTDETRNNWGAIEDIPVAGDFDSDGYEDDVALYRPSVRTWYFDMDHDGDTDSTLANWGATTDLPLAGDFDRDGFTDDIAVYRPSTKMWYYNYNHDGTATDAARGPWGVTNDIPVAGDFNSDGYCDDVGVFRSNERRWFYDYSHNATTDATVAYWAENGDLPICGDFDADGRRDDIAVYRPTDGSWWYDYNRNTTTDSNYGPWGDTGWNWHLPSWTQPHNRDDYPVGCGSTAWAMVYAYWRQFKGKTALFGGLDLRTRTNASDSNIGTICSVMWDLAEIMDTFWGGSGDDKWGATLPGNMPDGIQYAKDQGYDSASCVRWRGEERAKWRAIRDEIKNDRPVIMYINLNHYICIEAVHYIDRSGSDVCGYLGNWGWGDTQKWFYSRPTWWDPHESVYDVYFPRL